MGGMRTKICSCGLPLCMCTGAGEDEVIIGDKDVCIGEDQVI